MPIRPRILVVSPRYPYPLVSGDRVRIVQICRELARHFDLTLVCLCDDPTEFRAAVPQDAPFTRIERFWLPKWRSYVNVLGALLTNTPLQVAYYSSASFRARVRELTAQHDVLLAHLVRSAPYGVDARLPRVLEMTDSISMNYERVSRISSRRRLLTWVFSLERRRLRAFERVMIDRFDLVTLVSNVDRDHLLGTEQRHNVLVCSNGVDLDNLPFQPDLAPEPRAVFVGNLTTLQNLDAAAWFAAQVLPRLRRIRPWKLRLIGRMRRRDARRFARLEGVELTGEVPRIAEVVRGARAGVCPMRTGAGVQNKLLEYMALGLPAVSSSLSVTSVSAVPGRHVLVADEPQEYVTHLERLAADDEFSMQLAKDARAYVERAHDWSVHLAPLLGRVTELAAEAAGRGGQSVECN